MKVIIDMRLENNQEGNTWYSGTLDGQPDVQLHIPREFYSAFGSFEFITVTIEPDKDLK